MTPYGPLGHSVPDWYESDLKVLKAAIRASGIVRSIVLAFTQQ